MQLIKDVGIPASLYYAVNQRSRRKLVLERPCS